jgi:hypothetical protein
MGPLLSTIFQKQKGLAMNRENCPKIYLIDNKIVSPYEVAARREKKGVNNSAQTSISY